MTTASPATRDPRLDALDEYRAQCNGTENYHRHPLSRITYTDGVRFMAETFQAYWLIDVVLSHQCNRRAIAAARGFQAWTCIKNKTTSGCMVRMNDGGQNGQQARNLIAQRIEYTTLPRGFELTLYIENGVLLLPEER